MFFPPSYSPSPLLATAEEVVYRLSSGLLDGFTEWWQMPALVLGAVLVLAIVLWTYHHDAAGIPKWKGIPLALLRVGAWGILFLALLDLRRTAEHEVRFPSRVAVLVDTSASMTLAATDDESALGISPAAETSRAALATDVLIGQNLIASLQKTHEVALWQFADEAEPITVLPVSSQERDQASTSSPFTSTDGWQETLLPQGTETRLGEAVLETFQREQGESLAGLILLTDGGNNAGIDPMRAAAACADQAVAVHTIGLGSERLPTNVRVADLLAPTRVFPGDRFSVTGYLQAQGLEGQTAQVELLEADAASLGASASTSGGRVIDTKEIRLAADGDLLAIRFDLDGLKEPGPRVLAIRVLPPGDDRQPEDNFEAVDIEVVASAMNVLVLAGGPGREYRFLRNVLTRDRSFAVDVLLGSALPGLSQDARQVLDEFPSTAEALDAYDVLVAIDFDWQQLDARACSRLERWVARDSGGLFLMAGGVFMEAWLAESQFEAIRNLHPVELRRGERLLLTPQQGFSQPRPLRFSPDGEDAEFLWLSPNRIASQTIWTEFPGVYSCFDTATAKPGATVYARLGQADGLSLAGQEPVYLAGHLYGSGTVFYSGSSELWRVRGVEPAAYERLITQLVRHVAQGRLIRGSSRGRLVLERDRYPVGETVVVRVLPDSAQRRLELTVMSPDGQILSVPIETDPARPDGGRGSFVVAREGNWRISLTIDGDETDQIVRRIHATLPDRELARPRLERALLEQVATATGGSSRFLTDAAWTPADTNRLLKLLPDRSRQEYERGARDTDYKQLLNTILLAIGISLLCLEWILRRLVRLA